MLQSMTGYGEATLHNTTIYIHVLIKTLNGKYLDIQCNLPKLLISQESTWRKYLSKHLQRGKVILDITYHTKNSPATTYVNDALLKKCYQQLSTIAQELNTNSDVFGHALEITKKLGHNIVPSLDEKDIDLIDQLVKKAVATCVQNREKEAVILTQQLVNCLIVLSEKLEEIGTHIPRRNKMLRTKLNERIALRDTSSTIDTARWEQEILYYLEKMDIEEERTRLKSHLTYFQHILRTTKVAGKKLGFVSQEIGRELNTIASKAQDNLLQHIVVDMKQALEQIKEQLHNIV